MILSRDAVHAGIASRDTLGSITITCTTIPCISWAFRTPISHRSSLVPELVIMDRKIRFTVVLGKVCLL